ncbi:NAD(P)H-hydrate dehydratase [Natronoglycomyces albus]|uniref:Bifunctional NAD(P)H-hydrate repair enzyme n=1 Tax=Natronoglycomyces albus TaxID=2811108 RepID=A0A895XIC2_9ACTN|nr:NAD(P)H-hydrate dehydratase [Natronoglycomyces albus]QSB05561.1 NAD(P)H-hydrate dehydratase [Natronoglycomyces albus]
MHGVWRTAAVRRAEAELMRGLPPLALMHRAAAGLAATCTQLLRAMPGKHAGAYGAHITVLAGPGDNGGDALLAAERLIRQGAQATAIAVMGERVHRQALRAFRDAGGRLATTAPTHTDLLIDGIIGIGGRPGLPERAVQLLETIHPRLTVAVDVPSGVDVDTGAVPGPAVNADVTVTFGCRKPAHVLGDAALRTGYLDLIDIGLGPYLECEGYLQVPTLDDMIEQWPFPDELDDKYTRGVVGIAAGSAEYPGAAILATAGALSGPAGYVRYAGAAKAQVHNHHPEVVGTDSVATAGRTQSWLIGPGSGTGEATAHELKQVLARPVPAVLDADAITLLAQSPHLLANREAPLVLTPHDREFERLYGTAPGDRRAEAAMALAKRLHCTVLLKGHHTIVADSDGTVYVNPTGHPALATAGTGDVLAGLVASLLAAGIPAARAAMMGAFMHGMAARAVASEIVSPVASQIAAELPGTIGALND